MDKKLKIICKLNEYQMHLGHISEIHFLNVFCLFCFVRKYCLI